MTFNPWFNLKMHKLLQKFTFFCFSLVLFPSGFQRNGIFIWNKQIWSDFKCNKRFVQMENILIASINPKQTTIFKYFQRGILFFFLFDCFSWRGRYFNTMNALNFSIWNFVCAFARAEINNNYFGRRTQEKLKKNFWVDFHSDFIRNNRKLKYYECSPNFFLFIFLNNECRMRL